MVNVKEEIRTKKAVEELISKAKENGASVPPYPIIRQLIASMHGQIARFSGNDEKRKGYTRLLTEMVRMDAGYKTFEQILENCRTGRLY